MRYGADYYPEEWPRERWERDASLMAEAGFNVVRLGILAWAQLEPEPGLYRFDWLDDAVATLAKQGIDTLMSTPTVAPPPWLMDLDPQATIVREDGLRLEYGSWGNFCLNRPAYRERGRAIVEAVARRYGGHPSVIGWNLDCELGVHDRARCYCDACLERFRGWLAQRYGSVEELCRAWGAGFWSHLYRRWDQIPLPRRTGTEHNPGLMLDFARFCSDTARGFLEEQAAVVRQHSPGRPVTHNFLGAGYRHLDNFALAQTLDFVGWDNYVPRQQRLAAAMSHDLMRGLKRRPFWVLEQQCSHLHWAPYSALPPGVARLMSYQGVAHGADGIVYFRWRSGLIGAEQWHAGIVPHDGRPGRVYDEIRQLGQELRRLAPHLEGSTPPAEVAIVLDYESLWALERQPHHAALADPNAYFRDAYARLRANHVPVDFVPGTADLSGYRLVLAPALFVLTEEVAANLERYVWSGGRLLVTARSGQKDRHGRVVDRPFPGLLAPLVGATVLEFDSMPAGEAAPVRMQGGDWGEATLAAGTWQEALAPEEADVVARYQGGLYAGQAAATRRSAGEGEVLYLGAMGEELTGYVVERLLERAGVRAPVAIEAPPEVEVCLRRGEAGQVVFLLNFGDGAKMARLGFSGRDLLLGTDVAGDVEIEPYGVRVLLAPPVG